MEENKTWSHEVVCFQMLDFKTSNSKLEVSKSNLLKITSYVTSEGAVSHNVLYHQPLPITRYQVRFYVNNYFEYVPIVSTAFQIWGKFATHNHESVKFKRRRQDGSL
jgi:hypothetical protein